MERKVILFGNEVINQDKNFIELLESTLAQVTPIFSHPNLDNLSRGTIILAIIENLENPDGLTSDNAQRVMSTVEEAIATDIIGSMYAESMQLPPEEAKKTIHEKDAVHLPDMISVYKAIKDILSQEGITEFGRGLILLEFVRQLEQLSGIKPETSLLVQQTISSAILTDILKYTPPPAPFTNN